MGRLFEASDRNPSRMARFFQLVGRAFRFERGLMIGGLLLWPAIALIRGFIDPQGWSWTYALWVCVAWLGACVLIVLATALWWLGFGTATERRTAWEKRFWTFHQAEEDDPDI